MACAVTAKRDVADYIARYGRMSEEDARGKFVQILDAVDYCHKRHIVHRDLKVIWSSCHVSGALLPLVVERQGVLCCLTVAV